MTVIGAGTIGGVVAKALAEAGHSVIATRRSIEKAMWLEEHGVRVIRNNVEAAEGEEVVFIAVKPNKVPEILEKIEKVMMGKLVVSLAAGIPLKSLKRLAPKAKFVRAMPNIAILIKESFTAYTSDGLSEEDITIVENLFSSFGKCLKVDEEHMDAIKWKGLVALQPRAAVFISIEFSVCS
ncbi:pyrroline-5-carboxylate reductase family protein [Thermococcus piezophilus]|uniref:pyrroline-5-carboxylate reductase family protein n=1 Tax=Thermococcus piezophilus TaxID=1712654 RepID=UPI000A535FBC|nr:NAD(P)-binding domain-containing protein [Thermococcus piezophilus]